jgi:hypothetical protein
VTSENVVKEDLIYYYRGRELEQDVVPVAANVVHRVLVVASIIFAEVSDSQTQSIYAQVGGAP